MLAHSAGLEVGAAAAGVGVVSMGPYRIVPIAKLA